MAVVVDLDAPRRARQAEGLGKLPQQLLLRGGFGELAPKRLARVGERVLDQILFLAALRQQDLDLVAALGGKRLRQQFAVLDVVGDQDQPRARLVVVELREERAEHLAGRDERSAFGK